MSEPYPYIQTLHGFDDSISAYAIQPVSDDETTALPEENPIMAFGPLGKINIFVGATNAGKSRFLRTLAKSAKYQFLNREAHKALNDISSCVQWLANSTESIRFEIEQGSTYMTDGSPAVLHDLPVWAKNTLEGVRTQHDYEVLLDAEFFSELLPYFNQFVQNRIANPSHQSQPFDADAEEMQVAIWAKNLLNGEPAARARDAENKAQGKLHYTHQFESFTARRPQHLNFPVDNISQDWKEHYVRLWDAFERIRGSQATTSTEPPQRIYIPTLRSAVSLSDENGQRLGFDIFEKTVRRNYKLDDASLEIFTGNTLYETIRSDRNGTPEVVARLRDFEKFLGAAFYEGRGVEIVALDTKYDEGQHIDVRVQGETPRQLHHLGDGINTLVILLYQLFMAKPGSWIFIEEPELNLHPGLQRVFLQTLLENEALQKRNLRVFFTTHSNHLLRMTLRDGTIAAKDISVFAFQQRQTNKDQFLIRPLLSEHHDALALLGVQNASVLLAQCGVWVEGPTDRQYVRAFLRAYQESREFKDAKLRTMREDTHFAFWEYAGSNLAHYLMSGIPTTGTPEADDYERGQKDLFSQIQSSALCNRIFLLADRDETKAQKHTDLEALAKGRSNFVYCVTDGIEIENLLSPAELSKVLPTFLKGKPSPIPAWKQSNFKAKRMGTFLKSQFALAHFPASWREKSGTLSTDRKNRLCELAMADGVITWNTMSDEAKSLAKSLYEFVARHNAI